jgi:hypothetical protein
MIEGQSSVPTATVSYRLGDTPVALPGLALVGVKLIGLYALVVAVPQLLYLPLYALEPGRSARYLIMGLLPPAAYAAIGAMLLWKAEWVVSRMLRVTEGDAPAITATEHFQAIAFSVVGVLLMAWGVMGVAGVASRYVMAEGLRGSGMIVSSLPARDIVSPVVEGAAGLYLFLRGRGLAALWHRMRYGGVRVREAE